MTHVIPTLFTPSGNLIGGGERYALELARYMARQTPTRLLSFGEESSTSTVDGLEIIILKATRHVRGQSYNPYSQKMWHHLNGADVVHCHQRHVLISSLIALWGRLRRKPVFVSDLGGGGWDLSAYIDTSRWYRGNLHISQYSRRIEGHADLASARVIYGGVDIEKFSPDPTSRHDGPVVFVGRLLPHKGIDILVRACGSDIPLEIIGRPGEERYLRDLKNLAGGENVRFIHDADDAGIIRAYRNARCLVLPSVYRSMYGQETLVPELLGQTLIEGMACCTPAICSNVASMPEVVEDGVTGFVVPAADPTALRGRLLQLSANPELVHQLGLAARERVKRLFNWPAVVERCLEAYSE